MDIEAAKLVGAGISVVALAGVGVGIGNIFANLLIAIARNPSVKNEVMVPAYVGVALTEAAGILAFTVAMILLFVM